ncbi:MAG: hypothetical protein ABL985_13335 [Casimicrobium sp.]
MSPHIDPKKFGLVVAAFLTLPLAAQQVGVAEIDCSTPLGVKVQSDAAGELSLANPRLGASGPAPYFVRAQPSNLVANGDFETFTNRTLLEGPYHAVLVGQFAQPGVYASFVTRISTVPNWIVTGGNTFSYIWHSDNSSLLASTPSAGGPGYIYTGIGAQNVYANGVHYPAPYAATAQGRVVPPGPVSINDNFFGRSTGPVAIEQAVTLTPGRKYRMSFYVVAEASQTRSNHSTIDGFFGLDISGYAREYLQVGGYDNVFSQQDGRYYTIEFTAKQAATTVRFLNWGHSTTVLNSVTGLSAEIALDDVIINACVAPRQVPTTGSPFAFWALLGSLFLMGAATLRATHAKR